MTQLFLWLTLGLMMVLPLVIAVWFRRRYAVAWLLYCVGIATLLGSQVYHLPLNAWLTDVGALGPIAPDAPNLLRTAVVAGLSAAVCETLARVVGYAVLFRRKAAERWEDGVMVGLGHGGVESFAFVATLAAGSFGALMALRGTDLAALDIPAEQLSFVSAQIAMVTETPWMMLASALERMIAIGFHVSLSVMIWMGFKRRNVLYVLAAVAYHTLLDATVVYAGQYIENLWLLELLLAVLALPGFLWMLRLRPAARPQRVLMPARTELALFGTAVVHELRAQWRSRRVLIVVAIFLVFGLGSPLIAKYTPQLLSSIEGAELFADLIPEPTTADALNQYIRNLTQFGFLIAILLGMGAVAGEKERGTAPMILSKPLPRWAFVLSKFTAQALVYALGFALAAVGAALYTALLFDGLDMAAFMLGNVLLLIWLLAYVAITLLGSTLTSSTGAAAGVSLGGAILILLLGSIPQLSMIMPSALVGIANQAGLPDVTLPSAAAPVVATLSLILICLITAVGAFDAQEL